MYTWIALGSQADLSQLKAHISSEYDPDRVVQRLTDGLSDAIAYVLIEHNYVDKDYRSTYYNFYAKKGQTYRLDCARLHFFDSAVNYDSSTFKLTCPDNSLDDHYFGYMVLRPTGIASIGRSVLSPDVRKNARGPIITAKHKVHLLGYKLIVEGYPSMDQHIDISVCAHATCWSILRHYSERYTNYREFLTHEITVMAHPFNPGGLLPSKGLEVSNAERIFQAAGTFPMIVSRKSDPDDSFYRQLHAYVESGFPLFAAMHDIGHAIAVVGYDWRVPQKKGPTQLRFVWDEVKSLVVVDDNYLPYLALPTDKGANGSTALSIDTFIVALPEKIFYSAEAVDRVVRTVFKLKPLLSLPDEKETIARYFIATASGLRRFMRGRESEFDPKLICAIMALPLAQYVWVVELATEADWAAGQISARAVIDATASVQDRLPFWLVHNRDTALIFDRSKVGAGASGIASLPLSGMQSTALTRWDQNLRPTVNRTQTPKSTTGGGVL